MKGMSASTGAPLDGEAHLRQSITDILTTPLGSRVMRRDYGSLAFSLVDAASNAAGSMLLKAVCADALAKWEPRVKVTRIELVRASRDGKTEIDLDLAYADGYAARLTGLLI